MKPVRKFWRGKLITLQSIRRLETRLSQFQRQEDLPVSIKGDQTLLSQQIGCWTVQVSSKSRKEISLSLNAYCSYFVHSEGIFGMIEFCIMEALLSKLLGRKTSILEIRDSRERQTCLIALLILRLGEFRSGQFWEKDFLDIKPFLLQNSLSGCSLSYSTLMSRRGKYLPGPVALVQVPSDPTVVKKEGIPYSAYCKGYPTNGRDITITPRSYELDGEDDELLQSDLEIFIFLYQLNLWLLGKGHNEVSLV